MASPREKDATAPQGPPATSSTPEKTGGEGLSQAVSASSTGSRDNSNDIELGKEDSAPPNKRKGWLSKLNPIRRLYPVPRVPVERAASREKKAGFLSKITFQWMSPLMMVCFVNSCSQGRLRIAYFCGIDGISPPA